MATSTLLGIDRAAPLAPGRDSDLLGPSDSSDSGSDVAGLGEPDDGGPEAPLDKATANDIERPDTSPETVGPGVDSDSHGTGERRSAGGDAGRREAADISPDRIVSDPNRRDDDPGDGLTDDSEDADPALLATLAMLASPEDDEDEEIEDEDADPVGDAETNQRSTDAEGDDLNLVPPR